jgi:hypothetical protein
MQFKQASILCQEQCQIPQTLQTKINFFKKSYNLKTIFLALLNKTHQKSRRLFAIF